MRLIKGIFAWKRGCLGNIPSIDGTFLVPNLVNASRFWINNTGRYAILYDYNSTRALIACWVDMIFLVMTGHYETFSWLDCFFELWVKGTNARAKTTSVTVAFWSIFGLQETTNNPNLWKLLTACRVLAVFTVSIEILVTWTAVGSNGVCTWSELVTAV